MAKRMVLVPHYVDRVAVARQIPAGPWPAGLGMSLVVARNGDEGLPGDLFAHRVGASLVEAQDLLARARAIDLPLAWATLPLLPERVRQDRLGSTFAAKLRRAEDEPAAFSNLKHVLDHPDGPHRDQRQSQWAYTRSGSNTTYFVPSQWVCERLRAQRDLGGLEVLGEASGADAVDFFLRTNPYTASLEV